MDIGSRPGEGGFSFSSSAGERLSGAPSRCRSLLRAFPQSGKR
jgi:hypothetical protein